MKIILIKPIGRYWEDEQYYLDVGLAWLGTHLQKAGHEVRVLDCMRERLSWRKFERFVRENPFDLYCIKVYSLGVGFAIRAIEIIRRHHPDAMIGVGGPHPSGAGVDTLEHMPQVDFAWQGEAEIMLPRFLEKIGDRMTGAGRQPELTGDYDEIGGLIYRGPEGAKANPPYFHEPVDELGYPDWELVRMGEYYKNSRKIRFVGNYYVPVLSSRGCPMPCTYCEAWRLSGKKIRRHSVDYVIGWIEELKARYGINFFAFVDDALTADKEYFLALVEEILRRDLKIYWDCAQNAVRFDNLDADMLKLMERSGCFYMCVAVESGSPRILKAMKRRADLDLVREKVNLIKNNTRIVVMGYFILGYPTETWEDLKMTTRFSRELPLDAVQYFLFTPHPGSEIYEQLKAEGKIGKINWKRSHYGDASVPLEDVSLQFLNIYQRWAYYRFYNRKKFIFGRTMGINAPVELDFIRDAKSLFRAFMRELWS